MTPAAPSEDVPHEAESASPPASPHAPPTRTEDERVAEALTGLPFLTIGHAALFEPGEPRCDACDELLAADDDENGGGHGLYIWARHGEVTYEEPPLCASCATAITITALQRWEIEEEEG